MSKLLVTLTEIELENLVRSCVRAELANVGQQAPAEVLTLPQAAELFPRSTKIVMRLVREKQLPVHYISEREPRFRRSELLAWLNTLPTEGAA